MPRRGEGPEEAGRSLSRLGEGIARAGASLPGGTAWGDLSPGTRRYYTEMGIHPNTYNAWWNKPQAERTAISMRAKASGYSSGVQFLAVKGYAKSVTGRTVRTDTPAHKAAANLLHDNRTRALIPRLFPKWFSGPENLTDEYGDPIPEWEVWANFLSP
jgi:hypothetical protein